MLTSSPPPPLPEIRQCQDPDHYGLGSVAVAAGNGRWGIMHPANGGHWGTDAEVEGWTTLT